MPIKKLTENQAKLFVFEEVILLVLLIIQLYLLLGLDIPNAGLKLFANPAPPVENVLWFVGTTIIFVTAYFFISKRDPFVIKIHNNFSKIIFETLKKKILGINKNVSIILVTEFVFAIILAYSIFIYLDPEVNLVPWPYNYITFFVIFITGVYLFSQTKVFRQQTYNPGYLIQKIRPAKRLFPSRRMITNSGNIRVASKKHYAQLKQNQKKVKTFAERINKKLKK
jgi:hypothetical protein